MRYLGGKTKLSKAFAPLLDEALRETGGWLCEPFVGGFNVVPALAPGFLRGAVCSDVHPGLIRMYQELQAGRFIPPQELGEKTYQQLREDADWGNPLTAFAAFGCSFGGKEWDGYARGGGRNYAREAANSLLRKQKHMAGVVFRHCDYADCWDIPVIYADPPYENTTGYKTGAFDTPAFFRWCEQRAESAHVFVSEFQVPGRPGWAPVWSTERKTAVTQGAGTKRTDYLSYYTPPEHHDG